MLGGMAALPGPEWTDEPATGAALGHVTHVFTHFRLELSVQSAPIPVGEGWWQPLDGIADAGLPTLYRRGVDSVLSSRRLLAA